MSTADDMVAANARAAAHHQAGLSARPSRAVALVTCMDARIDVFQAFGLAVGEAHVIRNAGGVITPDVLRSVALSQHALGTREIVLVHHSSCGMLGFDDAAFRAELAASGGEEPTWDVPGFADPLEDVRASIERVKACTWLLSHDVRGFVLDVETGLLTEA